MLSVEEMIELSQEEQLRMQENLAIAMSKRMEMEMKVRTGLDVFQLHRAVTSALCGRQVQARVKRCTMAGVRGDTRVCSHCFSMVGRLV